VPAREYIKEGAGHERKIRRGDLEDIILLCCALINCVLSSRIEGGG